MSKVEPVRVLLAGMNSPRNQFIHALRRYPNVRVIHESGDPGRSCNTKADAAIIAVCHVSHGKFYTVKDSYKALGKPIFVANRGFSEIKANFESWLDGRPVVAAPTEEIEPVKPIATSMEQAFERAREAERKEKSVSQPTAVTKDGKTGADVIRECYAAGMSIRDTYEMIQAENLVTRAGTQYTKNSIAASMAQYKHGKRSADKTKGYKVKEALIPLPTAITKTDEATQIQSVLRNKTLAPDKKLELIEKITKGESIEDGVRARVIGDHLVIEHHKPIEGKVSLIAQLTRLQAIAIQDVVAEIKQFGTTGNIK